jgi:hypothetical protein
VARHQDYQLDALAEEKRVVAHQDRADPLLLDGRERIVNFVLRAGADN